MARQQWLLRIKALPENVFTDPTLRVGAHEETEEACRNFLAKGRLLWIFAAHERVANQQLSMRGMGPNRTKSLFWAGDHDVEVSCLRELPMPTSPTTLARQQWSFRTKSLPGNATLGPNLPTGPHGQIDEVGRSFHAEGTSSRILDAHGREASRKR